MIDAYTFKLVVSIHAFRGEGDGRRFRFCTLDRCFNPRLPGGRRPFILLTILPRTRVSIHAFRGEGDGDFWRIHQSAIVSIHAFRGEGDLVYVFPNLAIAAVSIHAFRGEGDSGRVR